MKKFYRVIWAWLQSGEKIRIIDGKAIAYFKQWIIIQGPLFPRLDLAAHAF
jgi:hypothetical protein